MASKRIGRLADRLRPRDSIRHRHAFHPDPFHTAIEEQTDGLLSDLYDRASRQMEEAFGELTAITAAEQETVDVIARSLGVEPPPRGKQAPDDEETCIAWRDVSQAAALTMLDVIGELGRDPVGTVDDSQLEKLTWDRLDLERFAYMTGLDEKHNRLALRLAASAFHGWVRDEHDLVVVLDPDGYLVVKAEHGVLTGAVVAITPMISVTPVDGEPFAPCKELVVTPLAGRLQVRRHRDRGTVVPAIGKKLETLSSFTFPLTADATFDMDSNGALTVTDAEPIRWQKPEWAESETVGSSVVLQRDMEHHIR